MYVSVHVLVQNGICPLHVCSKWGRVNIVSLLLDNNANIECRTRVCISVVSLCFWLLPYAVNMSLLIYVQSLQSSFNVLFGISCL